jgi:NADPH-dependent 2,4-dienoyl-CoA reductase/sulfur reductase-like enzyme
VRLTSGTALNYDYLIYAVGSAGGDAGVRGAAGSRIPSPIWKARNGCVMPSPICHRRSVTVVGGGRPVSKRLPSWHSKDVR